MTVGQMADSTTVEVQTTLTEGNRSEEALNSEQDEASSNSERSINNEQGSSLDLNVTAKVHLSGPSLDHLKATAQTLSASIQDLIEKTGSDDKDYVQLRRQESTALLADFSSAQTLLGRGIDSYVTAVKKVLDISMDESVTISFRDLCYTALKPKIGTTEGHSTVSSQLMRLMCGCCMLSKNAIQNYFRGQAPIEWERTPILKNLTGLIKPGRLTLILGPPGCGKTSFLKAISGKTFGAGAPGTTTSGKICFNERNVAHLKNLAAWVAYVGQSDEHQALLTVRETLDFAFRSRKAAFYDDEASLNEIRMHSGEAAVNRVKALREVEVDIALALLGLNGCANTIIGNENIKGVSGGERRRVTLGEMLVTGSQIMCCDEISTGLDSAATYDITAYLRTACHALRKSIIVALLQPPPEVIDLFDDIIVMAEGRIIFHGPREEIQTYFESLGFKLPDGKDLGDFIVELPTRNGVDMQLSASELEQLGIASPPVTPEEFARRWEESDMFKQEKGQIERNASVLRPGVIDYDRRPNRTFAKGLWDTIIWSMRLRLRDKVQIIARIVANIIVGVFFGTLFFQLTIDDWWLKAMLFSFALMFLVSTAFPVVQIMSQQRPIFYKHVEAKFYSASQFTLAQWVVSMPFVCFDVACFGTAMYWMCGLAPHAGSFFWFLIVCISFGICMNTAMSLFPFITPDEDTGIVTAALYLILSVVASGALSTESMIPILFRWLMWINPFAWSYRALAITEYHTPEYDLMPCSFTIIGIPLVLPVNCKDYFLQVREVRSDPRYVVGALLINLLFTMIFLACMSFALAKIRFETDKNGAIPEGPTANSKRLDKKRSVIERRALRRAYELDKYLTAVSPRALHNLAATNMPLISPMVGGVAGSAVSTTSSNTNLLSPLLSPMTQDLGMVRTPPKTLIIRDLWYSININGEDIDFLKGVSFYAKPGRMTALMGSSGAGKTTLMDVISGRKTVGSARGEILVNGQPKTQNEFVKYTAYVEQFGIHASSATVKESLEFSAKLRLPTSTTESEQHTYVVSVLELLELDDIQHALAGTLSMEQNKRLTLGVELVSNPSIVFCDEPTSGLDARAATIVMRVLLKVARSGRTVVATIHQPSTAIFQFFDDLLLLKRGGEVVYFGELGTNSRNIVNYIEAVPDVPRCPRNYNPATWMLEVIGAGTGADVSSSNLEPKDFGAIYRDSELKQAHSKEIENILEQFGCVDVLDTDETEVMMQGESIVNLEHGIPNRNLSNSGGRLLENGSYQEHSTDRLYVRSQLSQIKFLLIRNFKTYWRSPEFSLNRLLVVMLFTSIFACFFFRSKLNTMSDVLGRIVNIYFFSTLTCIYNLYTIVPFAMNRRALYYRERSANMYSVWAFNWAEGLVEVPWLLVQVVTTVPLIYGLTNLNPTWFAFGYFAICILLMLLLMTSMGLFAASLFPDSLSAQLASVMAIITLMVFCGILVPLQNLPKAYVPLYYFSFFKYSSEGLMTSQFTDLPDSVCMPGGKPIVLDDTGDLDKWIHHFFPHRNISHGLCSNTGTIDWGHPIASLSQMSGIQIKAETFVLDDFAKDYNFDNRWIDLLALIGWIVALRAVTFFTMYHVNHQRR